MRPMSRSHRCTGAESAFVDGPSLHPRSCSPVHAASLLRHRRRDRITSNVEVIDERPFLRRWRKGPSCSSRRHEGMEGTYVIDERPFLRRRRKGVSSTRTCTPGDGGDVRRRKGVSSMTTCQDPPLQPGALRGRSPRRGGCGGDRAAGSDQGGCPQDSPLQMRSKRRPRMRAPLCLSSLSRRRPGKEGTYVIDERPFLRRRRKGVSSTRTCTPGDGGTCAGGGALRAVPSSPREGGDVSSPGEMTKITASDLPFFGRSARSVLFQASVNWRSGIRQREDPSRSTGASSR
jgi:hypothetical protein